ncbi:hypothetical protein RMSM_04992 [Rhodopirellula maiorica SM1]|uniref:Uncharacterized protein n=1 Tax=Rhodopirellula maiorica SM1 TaxID=1265738 RepID=M5RF64_9BACT|nr:hypothetical protein RMSM_04992 [Rhodopirellula maiorica SM1]
MRVRYERQHESRHSCRSGAYTSSESSSSKIASDKKRVAKIISQHVAAENNFREECLNSKRNACDVSECHLGFHPIVTVGQVL